MRTNLTQTFSLLRDRADALQPEVRDLADGVLQAEPRLLTALDRLVAAVPSGVAKIRVHGDYHLGQVLWNEGDFFILDFEGEPARSMAERRARQSPFKDVAGMLRSFGYAAQARLLAWIEREPEKGRRLAPWATFWESAATDVFLQSYRAAANAAVFIPPTPEGVMALVRLFLFEKAVYELRYELNNRPDWLRIPLTGLQSILSATEPLPPSH